MKREIFDYRDYKAYLRELIDARPNQGRGVRREMAEAMNCPVSHVSQVLNGAPQLSLEQAEALNVYFGHTEDEAQFFFVLIQFTRAGTPALRARLEKQLRAMISKRHVLKDRFQVKAEIGPEDQAVFYSSWLYSVIHIMLTIESLQTREAVSAHLGISLTRASEILEFLVTVGLAAKKPGGRYVVTKARIHLGQESPLIGRFHTNWRMRAIQSFDRDDFKENLHYSSVVTLSESDVLNIKSLLVNQIAEIKKVVRDSPEECVHAFALDFFRI